MPAWSSVGSSSRDLVPSRASSSKSSKNVASPPSPRAPKQLEWSTRDDADIEEIIREGPNDSEALAVWEGVEAEAGNAGTMVLAVVDPRHVDQVAAFKAAKKRKETGACVLA